MKARQQPAIPEAAKDSLSAVFIDQAEFLRRVPISRRTLFNWRTSGKIPFINAGGRRILLHWPSVEAALLRQQREIQ